MPLRHSVSSMFRRAGIMAQTDLNPRIDTVRRFNRFYTRAIGVL